MPFGPRATSSTMRGIGKDVITTSQFFAKSATELTVEAPRSVQRLTAAGSRSNTTTSWLVFLMMLRHMGPPMLPTPMNPTFTESVSLRYVAGRYVAAEPYTLAALSTRMRRCVGEDRRASLSAARRQVVDAGGCGSCAT